MPTDAPTPLPWETVRAANGSLYRRSVQAYIINEKMSILAFKPIGHTNSGFRQCVQGGIDRGETAIQALARELHEESGLVLGADVTFIGEVLPLQDALAAAGEETSTNPSDDDDEVLLPDVSDEADGAGEPTSPVTAPTTGPQEVKNAKGETVSELRASFRYESNTWKKDGIAGQELFPMLLFARSDVLRKVRVVPLDPAVRREFLSAYRLPLSSIVEQTAPIKRKVHQRIVPAVYHRIAQYIQKVPELGGPLQIPGVQDIYASQWFQRALADAAAKLDPVAGLIVVDPVMQ